MQNAVSWFEIPVNDFARAKQFYETIFATRFSEVRAGETGPRLALFPVDFTQGVGGALAFGQGYKTAADQLAGVKVYLNGGDDLGTVLNRVEAAGGKVAVPKTHIAEGFGYMGAFIDTEGNWIGLRSIG